MGWAGKGGFNTLLPEAPVSWPFVHPPHRSHRAPLQDCNFLPVLLVHQDYGTCKTKTKHAHMHTHLWVLLLQGDVLSHEQNPRYSSSLLNVHYFVLHCLPGAHTPTCLSSTANDPASSFPEKGGRGGKEIHTIFQPTSQLICIVWEVEMIHLCYG